MSSIRMILADIVGNMSMQADLQFYDEAEGLNSLIDTVKESVLKVAVNTNFQGRVIPTETAKCYHGFTLGVSFVALPNGDSEKSKEATEGLLINACTDFLQCLYRHIAWYRVPTNDKPTVQVGFFVDNQKGNARAMSLTFSQEFVFDLQLPTFCPII